MTNVQVILVLSGKRKCGKDFVADEFVKKIGKDRCKIIRLSTPIKKHFSQKDGLDFQEMLSSSKYKEKIRKEMILWGEEQRNKDNGIFCRAIIEEAKSTCKSVWILSDARRITDIDFFKKFALNCNCKLYCIRIHADMETRKKRNWIFTPGVDDAESECALDEYNDWDYCFQNSTFDNVSQEIENVSKKVTSFL